MNNSTAATPLRVVVLISGNGSNLQAIIDDIKQQHVPAEIVAVFSNRDDAYGLTRARDAGIPTEVIRHDDFSSRDQYDLALRNRIDAYQPQLLVLAGFMRILSDDFVHHYQGRMINIHPSLLPKYQGLNTHQRVLDGGDRQHGASVHFVTPELDAGPVILQASIEVKEDDSSKSLATRIHEIEHIIYPQVVRWFAAQRLSLQGDTVMLDGKPITAEQKTWHYEMN